MIKALLKSNKFMQKFTVHSAHYYIQQAVSDTFESKATPSFNALILILSLKFVKLSL